MWNPLELVADSHFLDRKKFIKFALDNAEKFKIQNNMVSNWCVDDLKKAYTRSIGTAEWFSDRARVVGEIRARQMASGR